MKKALLTIAIGIALSTTGYAQKSDDKSDALSVINKMFAEMANHNPPAIAEVWTKESSLVAIVAGRDGKKRTVTFTGETFSKNFAEKKGEIKEDMYAPKVEVDGDIALISGRYAFFVDGKLSHCGLNAFQLVRLDGVWKVANAVSSIDAGGCNETEKALKPPPVPAKQ